MTVIAYRDGIMAGDSGSWRGDVAHSGAVKVAVSPTGMLAGAAGASGRCAAFLDAIRSGEKDDMPTPRSDGPQSDFTALMVEDGQIYVMDQYGIEKIPGDYYAIGAAAPLAMGAMHAGATATQAIEAAAAHSQYASLPVVSVSAPA